MKDVDAPDECVAGILSWFSTNHTSPADLSAVLTEFRRLLAPSGVLVLAFFDCDDELVAFDHAVVTRSAPAALRSSGRDPPPAQA